jgi:hypothetical protein
LAVGLHKRGKPDVSHRGKRGGEEKVGRRGRRIVKKHRIRMRQERTCGLRHRIYYCLFFLFSFPSFTSLPFS